MRTISFIQKTIFTAVLTLAFLCAPNTNAQTSVTTSNSKNFSISSTSKKGVRTYHVKNVKKILE